MIVFEKNVKSVKVDHLEIPNKNNPYNILWQNLKRSLKRA